MQRHDVKLQLEVICRITQFVMEIGITAEDSKIVAQELGKLNNALFKPISSNVFRIVYRYNL